jgi:hypothetical protein
MNGECSINKLLVKFIITLGLTLFSLMPEIAWSKPFNLTAATSGYLYFNMPGTNMARHDGELKNCIANWTVGESSGVALPQSNMGLVGDLVQSAMLSGWEQARKNINIEHCMVSKGWRLVRLAPDEGARLAQLSQKDLAAALQPYISSQFPKGEIVRIWRNEEIYRSTIIASSPRNAIREVLSISAISPNNPILNGISNIDIKTNNEVLQLFKPVALRDAVMPGPGQSLLIYTLRAKEKFKFPIFYLQQESLENKKNVGVFGLYAPKTFSVQSDGYLIANLAVLVPSGIWYVQGQPIHLDNCLGAPAFNAESESKVYLGTFDVTGDKVRVDTNADAVNHILPASIMATPAKWVNGYTYPCRQMSMYALEFDGFPFLPEYKWGSRAHLAH